MNPGKGLASSARRAAQAPAVQGQHPGQDPAALAQHRCGADTDPAHAQSFHRCGRCLPAADHFSQKARPRRGVFRAVRGRRQIGPEPVPARSRSLDQGFRQSIPCFVQQGERSAHGFSRADAALYNGFTPGNSPAPGADILAQQIDHSRRALADFRQGLRALAVPPGVCRSAVLLGTNAATAHRHIMSGPEQGLDQGRADKARAA